MGVLDMVPLAGIGTILQAASGIIGKIFGNKEEKEKHLHSEIESIQEGYQAEFLAPEKQSLFNIFVDGANRLVRPTCTYGIIALFIWAVVDPVEYSITMQAVTLIPEMLWWVFLTIIAFWFGGRLLEKANVGSVKPPSIEQVKEVVVLRNKMSSMGKQEDTLAAELKDTKKPLTNAAILEWNKQRGN